MNSIVITRSASLRQGKRILPEYSSVQYRSWWPAVQVVCAVILVLLSVFTGVLTAAGGTRAIGIVLAPIAFFVGLILWLLPDLNRESNAPIYKLAVAYMIAKVMWPSYISIVIPGLPWIDPPRAILFACFLVVALQLSQFPDARRRVAEVLGYDRWVVRSYMLYVFTLLLVVPVATLSVDNLTTSVQGHILMMLPAVGVAYALAQPGKIKNLFALITLGAIFTMLVSVLENYMQTPPWINYIPSFMRVDETLLAVYLSPQARFYDNVYRIRSTFSHVLYYSQYLSIVTPLVFLTLLRNFKRRPIISMCLAALLLQTVWFCNARTAVFGLLGTTFGFAGLWLLRGAFFRRTGDTMRVGVYVVFILLAAGALAGAIAGSHRLQMMVFGGAQHNASDDARGIQWSNARAQLLRNPIGIGIENVQEKVGSPSHMGPVVDSGYINLLVGVGPLGFLGFMGCIVRAIYLGVMTFLRGTEPDDDYAGIAALALINYIVTLYVISHFANNYLVAVFVALVLILHRQQALRTVLPHADRHKSDALSSNTALVRV